MNSKYIQEFKETEIGKIPKDWNVSKLEEHVIIKGRIGWKGLKKSEFSSTEDCIIVNGPDIKNGKINWSDCLRIPKWRYDESPEIMLKDNDILMTKDGTIGKTCFIHNIPENATVASGIFVIRNKSEILAQKFIYYYLNSSFFKNLVDTRIEGSVIPHLYQRDITKLLIPIPPKKTQEKIYSYIEILNSKIEILSKQNKILDKILRAIYKSWFIDFDDVEEFEDSQLGKIPKGWIVKRIEDEIELLYGKALAKNNRKDGDIPVYGSSGIIGCHDESLCQKSGIIVGRKGNVGSVFWSQTPFFVIDTAYYVKTELPLHYVYRNFQFQNFFDSDSSVPGLQRTQAYSLPILIPKSPILNKFDSISSETQLKIQNNKTQIDTLSKICDTLIPKLMSGEIRV